MIVADLADESPNDLFLLLRPSSPRFSPDSGLCELPETLLRHAVRARLAEELPSQRSGQGSEAAVHETVDRAADAVAAVCPGVGVVLELRCRARRISPEVHSSVSHSPNTIANVPGDVVGGDLGLGVSVHGYPMARVVLDRVGKDLCG